MGKLDSRSKKKLPAPPREAPKPARQPFDGRTPEVVDMLGQRWTLHILYALRQGPCRYNKLCRDLGINPATLSERFNTFLDKGIIIRKVLDSGPPPVVEYLLSPKGERLVRIFDLLFQWEQEAKAK